jgi:DNA-binding XRE family transcriptional regulator
MKKHPLVESLEEALAYLRGEKKLRTIQVKPRPKSAIMNRARLRSTRRLLGLTQSEMAVLLGYHPVSYRQIERGAWPITRRIERQVAAVLALRDRSASRPMRRAA